MNRRWVSVLSLAVVTPLAVDVEPNRPDSSVTSFTASLGTGAYADVTRGCQGEVLSKYQRNFGDAGFAASHRFAGPFEVGARTIVIRHAPEYEKNTWVWNPNASLEWRRFGVGLGYLPGRGDYEDRDFALWPVSGHIRIGPTDKLYFSIHALEDVPVASGGGLVRMGFGTRVSRAMDGWVGVSTPGPYDRLGLALKSSYHLNRNLDLNVGGRLGASEKLSECAVSAGLTVRFAKQRGAPPDSALPTSLGLHSPR
ncbi:MAG TPA: hypothetical protein VF363_00060 [Candidatus Eisenbacteria bacterium]